MNQIIQFPNPGRAAPSGFARQVSIDGEYFDDDVPPVLFDEDEDLEEITIYARIYENTMNE